MSHLAAIILEPKAKVQLQIVDTPSPGPHEILIKNELIALHPFDVQLARLAVFPLQYPVILGGASGGTVEAVGSEVTYVKVGDTVAAATAPGAVGNQYGAFQRYVVAREATTSLLSANKDFSGLVGLIGNLGTVVGLFSVELGLERPVLSGAVGTHGGKVLVYGGTSSLGSLSVQYLSQAGYKVTTTTSPKHESIVSKLGATQVINHKQDHTTLVEALVEQGPFDFIVDSISLPATIQTTAAVLAAQGGGDLYTMLPAFGPETLPNGVNRRFSSWAMPLAEEKHAGLLSWAFNTYLPQALSAGNVVALPTRKVGQGLKGLEQAFDILLQGVSGEKVILDPQE